MIRSQIIWSVVAAIVSGLLTSLGFPKDLTTNSAFAWVLPVALVPLFVAIEMLPTTYQPPSRTHSTSTRPVTAFTRGLEAFVLIWIFGAVLIGFAFHWVTVPAILFGELTPAVSYSLFALYCLLAGLYFTIIFFPLIWNTARCSKRSLSQFPVWCLVFTVASLESLLPRIFHWTFGNLMYGSLPVVQWSSWIGSSGLSVLVFASNFYLARALTERPQNPGRLSLVLVSVAAGWLCIVLVGRKLIAQTQELEKNARTTHIGFVQPNFGYEGLPRNRKYSNQLEMQSLSSLMNLTEEMVKSTKGEKLDLIVWPESAAPYNFGWSEILKKEVL
ncbi:MAG: apolipoprotein N-acyltransferase, partial [Pseudomonadota bacterium]